MNEILLAVLQGVGFGIFGLVYFGKFQGRVGMGISCVIVGGIWTAFRLSDAGVNIPGTGNPNVTEEQHSSSAEEDPLEATDLTQQKK